LGGGCRPTPPTPQTPNPQSPIPNPQFVFRLIMNKNIKKINNNLINLNKDEY